MIYDTGNRLLDQMERRFGRLALPKPLRWIAGFQLLSWLLSLLSPEFLDWITFDREAIFEGQVWRLFTWVVYPAATNPLFVLFAVFFMFFINDSIEAEWDSFRLNVYVIASIAAISLSGLLPVADGAGMLFNFIFYSSVFLAFATLFPDQVIHLFGIIPIKAKWLGWANGAMLGATVITSPAIVGAIVLIGMTPYLVTFVPGIVDSFRRQSEAKVRRHKFEGDTVTGDAFHECTTCGATEKTHPTREFRVSGDGEEYCDSCRKPA